MTRLGWGVAALGVAAGMVGLGVLLTAIVWEKLLRGGVSLALNALSATVLGQ